MLHSHASLHPHFACPGLATQALIRAVKTSYTVLGWRRLGQVIGQCGALTPAPNVVEQNATKAGFNPTTGVLRNPSRPNGR